MQIEFVSADHNSKQPNYRVRHYNSGGTVVRQDLFAFAQAVVVPDTTPTQVRLVNVPKPLPPHTSDYRVTVEAEASTGNSGESAMTAPYSLTPPAVPQNVVVIDPQL